MEEKERYWNCRETLGDERIQHPGCARIFIPLLDIKSSDLRERERQGVSERLWFTRLSAAACVSLSHTHTHTIVSQDPDGRLPSCLHPSSLPSLLIFLSLPLSAPDAEPPFSLSFDCFSCFVLQSPFTPLASFLPSSSLSLSLSSPSGRLMDDVGCRPSDRRNPDPLSLFPANWVACCLNASSTILV